VVAYLVDHADHDVWGYLVANDLGLHHGTIYPILERLCQDGLTTSRDESPAEWAHRGSSLFGVAYGDCDVSVVTVLGS